MGQHCDEKGETVEIASHIKELMSNVNEKEWTEDIRSTRKGS